MRSRLANGLKVTAIIAFVTVLLDVGTAQLAKRFWPFWDVPAIERSYRMPSPLYHHDLRPMQSTTTMRGHHVHTVRTNSLGFRDAEARDIPLISEKHRVLIIGDSFTEGFAMAYEDSFVGHVDRCLSGEGIEVLNAGVVSYSPMIYFRKIRHLIETVRLEFDEVVVLIDISDIMDDADRVLDADDNLPSGKDEQEVSLLADPGDFLRTNSIIYRVLHRMASIDFAYRLKSLYWAIFGVDVDTESGTAAHAATDDTLKAKLQGQVDLARGVWTVHPERYGGAVDRGFDRSKRAMSRLKVLLDEHGKALTVVVYPWPDQLFHGDRESLQVREWHAWSQTHGARFIDLFPVFFDLGPMSGVIRDYFIPFDAHWNAAGNKLAAGAFLSLSGRPTCGLPVPK